MLTKSTILDFNTGYLKVKQRSLRLKAWTSSISSLALYYILPWIQLFLILAVRGHFHGPIVMKCQLLPTPSVTRQELKDNKGYEILPKLSDCNVGNSVQNLSTDRRCKIRKPISEKISHRSLFRAWGLNRRGYWSDICANGYWCILTPVRGNIFSQYESQRLVCCPP